MGEANDLATMIEHVGYSCSVPLVRVMEEGAAFGSMTQAWISETFNIGSVSYRSDFSAMSF
ncbi:hypothetical protein HAX54_042089, partial [Datura stramonium]|nr:hypothetical protein [Datura stramonium]